MAEQGGKESTGQGKEPAPKKGSSGFRKPLKIMGILAIVALFLLGLTVGPLGKSIVGDVGLPGWLSVPQPHPELPAQRVFQSSGFLTNSIIAAWITIVVLVGFSYAVTRRLRIIPGRLQALLEFIIGALLDFCKSVAGEKNGRRFFPIVATIFLFVAFNGWIALLPGFGSITAPGFYLVDGNWEEATVHLLRPANTDINMPLAIALMSFIAIAFFGISSLGFGYVKKFANVDQLLVGLRQLSKGKFGAGLNGIFLGVIHIFIGMIEALSNVVRIVSFTLRLFGNMTAGEILLVMATFLVPFLFALPFYGLELLVGFVQALIFAGLTLIFLTVAVTSHEENHEKEAA